ncbi:hypothetical protein P3X46_032024 [Hevea brasiliensis]|uniref:Hyccin n=1 Tax=Hevea brasiliensis TaxID=3981 RepID=A0ABQ9KM62_HEVBR|nr:uncharacterized protein LOC110671624 [Hevea brasiliensis]XP_021689824.2 uncharacterized protein LOC110671624 [Hevea brasiliensis]XP_021689825.2 uncharacterized protein LOC110671624 [Hevea brasiliensis]KAJ9141489.1 hypothetical protein P3X46_032024 [Hevea brasiliensis]
MDLNNLNNYSPSSSSSTPHPSIATTAADPMQSWWESISKARARILSLSSLLHSDPVSSFSLSSLADSDRPALSFLSSFDAYTLLSSALSSSTSGSGPDPLCQWLYDTYLSSDPHLRLIVLSFLPLLLGLYLSRIHSSDSASTPSLAGFEAVLLAIYSSEVKSRAGKPVLVQIPDLSQPSLYHTPRNKQNPHGFDNSRPSVGVLSPPLEPQIAVKSTKRPVIVGVALDCYFKQISQMPSWSKVELCKYASAWAGQDCACKDKLDGGREVEIQNGHGNENNGGYFLEGRSLSNGHDNNEREIDVVEEMEKLEIEGNGTEHSELKGVRIPLPWEILQPLLRLLGHCLLGPLNSQDVKDAASVAVRRLYARGSHDLAPQAILATRSLIQLDKRAREAAKVSATAAVNSSSNANTPSKAKKPEIFLVSK